MTLPPCTLHWANASEKQLGRPCYRAATGHPLQKVAPIRLQSFDCPEQKLRFLREAIRMGLRDPRPRSAQRYAPQVVGAFSPRQEGAAESVSGGTSPGGSWGWTVTERVRAAWADGPGAQDLVRLLHAQHGQRIEHNGARRGDAERFDP